jgi:hypothetical protein
MMMGAKVARLARAAPNGHGAEAIGVIPTAKTVGAVQRTTTLGMTIQIRHPTIHLLQAGKIQMQCQLGGAHQLGGASSQLGMQIQAWMIQQEVMMVQAWWLHHMHLIMQTFHPTFQVQVVAAFQILQHLCHQICQLMKCLQSRLMGWI